MGSIRRAVAEARDREKTATKIVAVRYDRARDAIAIEFSTGAMLVVPRAGIAGFSKASPSDLKDIKVTPGGEGLWSASIDDGALLDQLIVLALGERTIASLGARINASKTSPTRAVASRANGAKGGRPMTMTSFVRRVDEYLHALVPNAPGADTSSNPNPAFPTGVVWNSPKGRLSVKIHEARVMVQRSWTDTSIEPRDTRTASRLARDFAERLRA